MNVLLRRSTLWVLLNLGGIALYTYLGMALWVRPGEEGTPGGPGDAFYWVLTLVPLLVIYLILNTAALVAIAVRVRRSGKKKSLYIWLTVAAVWLVAVAYGHYRSYRVISPEFTSAAHAVPPNPSFERTSKRLRLLSAAQLQR